MKKNNKINFDILKRIFIVSVIVALVLSLLLFILNRTVDYSSQTLKTNKKTIFTIDDLKVNNLKFGDNEKTVIKELGKAKKEKKETKNSFSYKILTYKGLELTLRENYSDYILVGAKSTSRKYKLSRDVRVNDNVLKVINKFNVTNKKGSYMYGNYTSNALSQAEITDNIYFGLRTKKQLMYINRDSVSGSITNVAELNIKYKYGKVKMVKWSYDFN